MSVGVDFFKSEFLFQAFDTEVVWTWDLTDDQRAMFYDVVPQRCPPWTSRVWRSRGWSSAVHGSRHARWRST